MCHDCATTPNAPSNSLILGGFESPYRLFCVSLIIARFPLIIKGLRAFLFSEFGTNFPVFDTLFRIYVPRICHEFATLVDLFYSMNFPNKKSPTKKVRHIITVSAKKWGSSREASAKKSLPLLPIKLDNQDSQNAVFVCDHQGAFLRRSGFVFEDIPLATNLPEAGQSVALVVEVILTVVDGCPGIVQIG